MKNFKNKVIVITGASSGMGRSYAIEFAKLGAKVALSDIDQKGLDETVELVKALPQNGIYAEAFDVGNKEAIFQHAENVKAALGCAHVIINNAGIGGGGGPVWNMSPEQYEKTMNINYFGVLHGTLAFLPQLVENNEGAIVNVSSVFGLIGTPNSSDYCAAKFAVRGFSESLMVELHETPITVHLVHPGGVKTNIAMESEGGEAFTEKYLKTLPGDIAREVIDGIRKGRQRIVCGHQSKPLWFLSWAIPLRWRNKLINSEMKDLMDPEQYANLYKTKSI